MGDSTLECWSKVCILPNVLKNEVNKVNCNVWAGNRRVNSWAELQFAHFSYNCSFRSLDKM